MSDHSLVVYSDYVCPFCYLGRASLRQFLDDSDDPPAVEWRPFDLRGYKRAPDGTIDHDVDDGKDDDYFSEVKENVQRLAAKYDVEMTTEFDLEVDSWNAQQVALYVRESVGEAAFQDFHHALFDALWVDGRDVGDPEVLEAVARSVDLDGDVVETALSDEVWSQRLEERFAAANRAGVTGIPTFVYGDHAARGAVPPEQLQRLVGQR